MPATRGEPAAEEVLRLGGAPPLLLPPPRSVGDGRQSEEERVRRQADVGRVVADADVGRVVADAEVVRERGCSWTLTG